MEKFLKILREKAIIIVSFLIFLILSINSCKNGKIKRLSKKNELLMEQNDSLRKEVLLKERKVLDYVGDSMSKLDRSPQMKDFQNNLINKRKHEIDSELRSR